MKLLIVIFMLGLTSCKTLYWSNMNNVNAPIDQSKTYNNSTVIDNSKSGPSYDDMRMNSLMNDNYRMIENSRPSSSFEYTPMEIGPVNWGL